MQTALDAYAIDCTYDDVRGLIIDTACKFRDAYGGDLDELIGEAELIFVQRYRRREPGKGTFENWIRYKIWNGLLDEARKIAKRRVRAPMELADLDAVAAREPAPPWALAEFLGALGEDAAYVAGLALDPPIDVRLSAAQRHGEQNPRSIRLAVAEFLKDMGWAAGRIAESFNEIREVLQ